MTNEEKARAYDKALKRAKAAIDIAADKDLVGGVVRTILPELYESEDDRMVRAIEHILYENYSDAAIIEGVEIAEIVTWLEKQKEQKPLKVGENAYFDPNTDMWFIKKEQKHEESVSQLTVQGKGVYKICPRCKERMVRDDSMVYTSMPPQYIYECPKCGERECDTVMYDSSVDEKQQEQKPILSDRDLTDFEIEVHEIIAQARNDSRLNDADVLKQFEEEAAFALMLKANKLIEQKPADLPAGFYVTLPDGEKYYAKEIRCNGMNIKVVEPKPVEWDKATINGEPIPTENHSIDIPLVEWSENDEKMFEAFMHKLEVCDLLTNKEIMWAKLRLKSLHPQPKVEWSDEDETHRDFILELLENQIRFCKKDAEGARYAKQIRTAQDWLKSLRPQPQEIYQQVVKGLRDMCNRYEQNGTFTDERARDFLGNVRVKCKDAIECVPILDESSWKPSEHQMTILKAVKDYVGVGSGYWGEALGSLIEDLEKL